MGVGSIHSKFSANTDSVEEQLKQQTIGLVTFEDFKKKRENLEKQALLEQLKKEQR